MNDQNYHLPTSPPLHTPLNFPSPEDSVKHISDWLIALNPHLLSLGASRGRLESLNRPQIKRRLINMPLKLKPAISNVFLEVRVRRLDPQLADLGRGQRARDVVDFDAHKVVHGVGANVEALRGDGLEDDTDVEGGQAEVGVDLGDGGGEGGFLGCAEGVDGVEDGPERHFGRCWWVDGMAVGVGVCLEKERGNARVGFV